MVEGAPDHRAEFYSFTRAALGHAATELLRYYCGSDAVALEPENAAPASDLVLAATLGFAGPSLNGTLAVAVPQPLLGLLSPLKQPTQKLSHGDWIAELANQLLGRVKNQLVAYGIDMRLGTPAVVEGRDLRLHATGNALIEHRLRCREILVCVWLDMVVSEDLRITKTKDESADEGSVLLF
jgi:CheY-specific phosphatase CheX